jgi:HAMP domain-containing protein
MSHSSAAKGWAVAVAVALVALLVVWLRPSRPLKALPEETAEQAAPPPPAEPRPPSVPPPAAPPPAPGPTSTEADPYGMPKPSSAEVRPRPDQRPATPEEQKETQKAAQELVESGIARLESERRQAEQTGDTETARRNQIRIERLRKRLETLKQEAAASP